MKASERLRNKINGISAECDRLEGKIEKKFDVLSSELDRVGYIAANASEIIDQIDMEFERKTGLTGTDIQFLFLATALQVIRWWILDNSRLRITSQEGDRLISRCVPKSYEDILLSSVPYDAISNPLNLDTGLSGTTHRYRTLGHDPILGWIFGPINILSDSLTKSDFITTYSVQSMKIVGPYPDGTAGAITSAINAVEKDKLSLCAAVARQAIHFGSDCFTKQGLPMPCISTLSPDIQQQLVLKFNVDIFSVFRSAGIALLINSIIGYAHFMFFDGDGEKDLKFYEVRTKKILTYSNMMSSCANLAYLYASKDFKKLDIGGILVALYRNFQDRKFIHKLKQDFIYEKFEKIVMEDSYVKA